VRSIGHSTVFARISGNVTGQFDVEVVSPVCTGSHQAVSSDGLNCVCQPGYYLVAQGAACEQCPIGTYQPVPVNGSIAACKACLAGYYCLAGSASVSGVCPARGFLCTGGKLEPLNGFWMREAITLQHYSTHVRITAYPCLNSFACAGVGNINVGVVQTRCVSGYDGPLCASCATGWAGLGGYCTKCYNPALAVFGLLIVTATIAVLIGVVAVVFMQENVGRSNVSMLCCVCVRMCVCARVCACVSVAERFWVLCACAGETCLAVRSARGAHLSTSYRI
jgi:hypothetical protein